MIPFNMTGGSMGVFGSPMRGANGLATFNVMMSNRDRQIQGQGRRMIKRAAFYLRKVARSKIKRGRTKVQRLPNRMVNPKTGEWMDSTMKTKHRTRSTPPNSPLSHTGKQMGLKSLWAEKYRGSPDAWIIAPLTFVSKGAAKVNFKIHRKLAKGGSGKVYMPVNDNVGLSKSQMFTRGLKEVEWRWVPAKYPKRPYMSNAIPDTRKKFPDLWYKSKER